MSKATDGLRTALARGASGNVLAIAEMQVEDILAGMNDEQKAELSAALTPPAPAAGAASKSKTDPEDDAEGPEDGAPDAEDEAEGEEGQDPKKAGMGKKSGSKAAVEPAGANAERARVKAVARAVAEDEPCKGKADIALAMLADDDFAGLNASAMVKMLGKQSASSAVVDPDAAARAEMKAALKNTQNSNLDPNGGKSGGKAEDSAAVWDSAIAKIAPNKAK